MRKRVEPICKQIGENIRKIRKKNGLTQQQFAKRLKVTQQLISRIEKGYENLSLITLKNIASGLDEKVDFFFK